MFFYLFWGIHQKETAMEIILIAAMARNRVIGRDNCIPWHISEEIHHFKTTTMDHAVVMGRKTFESIGRPLPKRFNVVLSRQRNAQFPGCTAVDSLEKAIKQCGRQEKVFIIGGESIYREAMSITDTILLSVLDREYAGDIFFPEIPESIFDLNSKEQIHGEQTFSIHCYQRRKDV